MRQLFNLFGYFLLILGAMVFGFDTIDALETSGFAIWDHTYTDTGTLWFTTHMQSLQVAQAIIQRYLHPLIWDPGIQWILLQPGFAVLMIIGLIFITFTGKKKRNQSRFSRRP